MVYGELGRLPLEIMVKQKLVLFWNSRLIYNQILSSIIYAEIARKQPHKV
jgi:hypothetical protein